MKRKEIRCVDIRDEKNQPTSHINKRYNLVIGATHGLCHNLTQLGYFRPGNRHARYHNLYFAGASTRPGTGIPTALIAARLAAERMMNDL